MEIPSDPDELEDFVLSWLSQQQAALLEEVYLVIPLECSDDMKGKKKKLLNNLLVHFVGLDTDEEESDGGHSTYLKIADFIKKISIKKEDVSLSENKISGISLVSPSASNSTVKSKVKNEEGVEFLS